MEQVVSESVAREHFNMVLLSSRRDVDIRAAAVEPSEAPRHS